MSYLQARRALDLALRALHEAYEQARAAGYPSGSPEMQALERAERAYRHARRVHGEALRVELATDPGTGDSAGAPPEREIDLSDDDRTVDLTHPGPVPELGPGDRSGDRSDEQGQRPRPS